MDPASSIAAPITMCPTTRPTTTFAHRPSGSFLNTVSNQFTPSPSLSPGPTADNTPTVRNLDLLNDEPSSEDGNDFDMPEFDDADIDSRLECGGGGENHMEIDSEAMQQKEVEPRNTLDKVCFLLTHGQTVRRPILTLSLGTDSRS